MKFLNLSLVKQSNLKKLKEQNRNLSDQIISAKAILNDIEGRNWEIALSKINRQEESTLFEGLQSLTLNLKQFWAQEESRNWSSEGMLKIGNIVNQNQSNLSKLADELIRTLVQYSKANQGALFIVDDKDPQNISLEMIGCYAYEKKKYINKKIGIEEGLLGQSFMEGSPVYMTDIPPNYIKITSGLGEALPRSIIMLPVIGNKMKIGMIELAFFYKLEPYEREFLISIGEVIGNALFNIRSNEKTLELLSAAEKMSEELRNSEEELKQNMEEMIAIQEDLSRKNNELEKARKEIEQMTQNERALIESKLATQQTIHDKITETLKSKIVRLQYELKVEKEHKAKLKIAV